MKLRRSSLRLRNYDYTRAGAYFITISTKNRQNLFGQMTNTEMVLNELGLVVQEEWLKLPSLRRNVEIDEFIVMPNHFHAILWLLREEVGTASRAPTIEKFGQPVSGSLSSIIRGYKSGVSKRIKEMLHWNKKTVWQRSYYEHVIRNEESLNRVREYINTNLLRWALDRENPRRTGTDEFDHWLDNM